jgi:hypothetical protein
MYLEEYIQYKDLGLFLKILEYFGEYVDANMDYYRIIVTLFKIYKEGILLGILDEDGIAELYILRIHEDFSVLERFKAYYRNIPEFWREYGDVYRIEKKEGVYRCKCGFLTDDFEEFKEHFLTHEEIQNRHEQIRREEEILKEEKEKEERMNA